VKRTIIIQTSHDLRAFRREFRALADTVRAADGSYVMYEVTPSGALPSIISKGDFDRVVSGEMYGERAAFSRNVAGGRFLPDRLNRTYGALAREAEQHRVLQRGQRKLLNRAEFIAYYYGSTRWPRASSSF